MKRFLSLFLSCIFVMGVCFSTPVIAHAEGAVSAPSGEGFTYTKKENTENEYELESYTGDFGSINITNPDSGYTITSIATNAFSKCDNLRYIHTNLAESLFANCSFKNNVTVHYSKTQCAEAGSSFVVEMNSIIEKCNCGTEIGRATLFAEDFIVGEENPIKVEKIGTFDFEEVSVVVNYYESLASEVLSEAPTTVGSYNAEMKFTGNANEYKVEKTFVIYDSATGKYTVDSTACLDTVNNCYWVSSESSLTVNACGNYNIASSPSDNFANSISLAEGSHNIYLKGTDNEEISMARINVAIDSNPPEAKFKIGESDISETVYVKAPANVVVTTNDKESGIAYKGYHFTTTPVEGSNYSDIEWTELDDAISIEEMGEYTIYVKLVDEVGNDTVVSSEKIVVYKDSVLKDESVSSIYNSSSDKEVNIEFNGNTVSSIVCGEKELTQENDYAVDTNNGKIVLKASYLNSLSVGEYTYTISYEADCVESATFVITITAKEFLNDNLQIADIKDQNYTGSAITPGVTVTDGEKTLVSGTDYTIEYSNNTAIGIAIATIKFQGNYSGEITKKFKIVENAHRWGYSKESEDSNKIIATCQNVGCEFNSKPVTIILNAPESLIYDGTEKEVTVGGAIDGVTIPAVEYSGDRKNVTEAGFTATLTIDGVTATLTSKIVALDITDKDGLDIGAFEEMTYTGEAQTPVATVKIGDLEVTGSWSKVVNVSDKTTFTANGNFTGTIENVATGMKKADITYTAPTPKTDLVANGEPQALVTAGSTDFGELQYSLTNNGEDWSSDIPTGTQAKTYTVYYRVLGNDNVNNVDVASVTVTIKAHTHNWNYTADGATIKAVCNGKGDCDVENNTATIALKAPASLIYDETDKVVTVDGAIDGVDIPAVEYSGDRKNVTEAGFTATLTIDGVTATLTSKIVALDITDKYDLYIGAFEEMTYTGKAQTPVATVKIGNLEVTGSWSKVVNVSDKTTFTANGNFTGTIENVTTGMKKATVTIKEVEAVNREYDGTNVVKLSGGVIDGVKSSDIVTLDLINVTATVEDVKAGEYTVKFEGTPVLKGEDIDNYELDVTLPETKVVILQCSEHKSFDDGVVTIEPTCKSKGIKSFTCGCGYIKNESVDIDPDAHKVNEWALGKEASCMNTGTETGKCELCEKDVERETPKNPNNHNIKYRQEKAPTCVEEGVLVIYCANDCGYKEEQSIVVDETAHDMSGDWSLKTPATCSTDGVEVKVCQNEGCTHEETRPVKADGESHSMGEWIVDTVATCMAEGQKVRACTIKGCTHKETEVIPVDKTAHDMSGEWKTTIAATCVDEGEEELKCKNEGCNHIETRVIEPDGKTHKLSGWRISVAVKCTVAGEIENVCTNKGCTYRQIMPIEPDGKSHDPAEEFTVIPATCVKTGEKFKICENPDCTVRFEEEILEIDKDAHTKTELVKESAPTCLEIGYSGDTVCVDCEKILEPGMEIPATGHKSSDWIVDKKATFKATGERHKECTTCKEVLKKEKIAKLTLDTPKVKIENAYNGIKVTWSQDEDAEKYIIYSSEYNTKTKNWSSWKNRGTVKATVKSWVDTKVKNNVTYRYTVKAVNGEYKSSNKATSGLKFITAPTAKVSVTATGVLVKWNKISIADNYIVYRSESKNGKWQDWKKLGTTKPAKNSWTDTKAKSGVTYRYTVIVLDGKTKSGPRASASIIFLEQPTLKISNGASGVTGKWEPISGAKGYTVLRSEYNAKTKKWSKWLDLGTAKSTAKSFTDKTVKSGVTYRYALRAVNGKFKSTYQASNTLIYLARPTLKIANTSSGIKGTWNKISGATGYTIYRSELKNGKWTEWLNLGTAKSTAKSFTDKTVKSGTTYKYKLRAINGKYKSSDFATGANVFLSTPTVKIANASTGVKVSWGKITGADSYKIYRRQLEDGKWTAWKALGTTTKNSYVDKTANNNVNYRYTVKAINGKCYSEVKTSSTLLYLAAPTVVVENVESGINVSWNKISGAKTYAIYRANLEKDGDWSDWGIVATVKNNKLSVTDKTVKNGETYRYIVRAVSDKVKSSYVASSAIVAGENFQEETTQPTESTT